jgi:hypothetical protein
MLKPNNDPLVHFCSLLLMVKGVMIRKEETGRMKWCHTEGSGGESLRVNYANMVIKRVCQLQKSTDFHKREIHVCLQAVYVPTFSIAMFTFLQHTNHIPNMALRLRNCQYNRQ